MYWLVLILSGALEAVWAVALSRSEGFTRLVPSLVFGAAIVVSMGGLAYAMRGLPLGTRIRLHHEAAGLHRVERRAAALVAEPLLECHRVGGHIEPLRAQATAELLYAL